MNKDNLPFDQSFLDAFAKTPFPKITSNNFDKEESIISTVDYLISIFEEAETNV